MTLRNGRDFLRLVATPPPPADLALGYVTNAAGPFVTFDQDTAETTVALSVLSNYNPALGDRVLMQRINGAWVILGNVTADGAPAVQGWQSPAYGVNWTDFDAGTFPAQFTTRAGWVKGRGLLKATAAIAANAVMLTLPVGMRPGHREPFGLPTSRAGVQSVLRCDVFPDGTLVCSQGVTFAANDWVSMAGLIFIAEN